MQHNQAMQCTANHLVSVFHRDRIGETKDMVRKLTTSLQIRSKFGVKITDEDCLVMMLHHMVGCYLSTLSEEGYGHCDYKGFPEIAAVVPINTTDFGVFGFRGCHDFEHVMSQLTDTRDFPGPDDVVVSMVD